MISTYLFERNKMLREGLKSFLTGSDFNVTAEFGCMNEYITMDICPDLIIAGINRTVATNEISTASIRFSEQATKLRCQLPAAKLVILASAEDLPYLPELMTCHADGYLLHDISPAAMLSYLRLAMIGEKILPEAVAVLFNSLPNSLVKPTNNTDSLSQRENEIMHCLALGESNKLIAKHLEIAESTVKVHLKSILRKLGVKNRTQAVMLTSNNSINDNLPKQAELPPKVYAA